MIRSRRSAKVGACRLSHVDTWITPEVHRIIRVTPLNRYTYRRSAWNPTVQCLRSGLQGLPVGRLNHFTDALRLRYRAGRPRFRRY